MRSRQHCLAVWWKIWFLTCYSINFSNLRVVFKLLHVLVAYVLHPTPFQISDSVALDFLLTSPLLLLSFKPTNWFLGKDMALQKCKQKRSANSEWKKTPLIEEWVKDRAVPSRKMRWLMDEWGKELGQGSVPGTKNTTLVRFEQEKNLSRSSFTFMEIGNTAIV